LAFFWPLIWNMALNLLTQTWVLLESIYCFSGEPWLMHLAFSSSPELSLEIPQKSER
jgi:hypothetical protein